MKFCASDNEFSHGPDLTNRELLAEISDGNKSRLYKLPRPNKICVLSMCVKSDVPWVDGEEQ